MNRKETLIEKKEHRAIVFRLTRKEAAAAARYIKEHSGSSEIAFAVDVDDMVMILQAKTAHEEDFLMFPGEEDIFDIEDSEIEEEIEVEQAEDETEE